MCGICGIIKFNNEPAQEESIRKMMHIMKHRGPDDEGVFIDQNVVLGFVRLSILDLSPSGHQPMLSHDGRYVIVFNGEVYNYIELKDELSGKYNFITRTDTEVVLAAYQEWGASCLDKFNGMWAFAIYDKKTKEIFCARDRFGIKPFYYYHNDKQFVFASDIPSILSVMPVAISPNEQIIFDYLAFGRTDQNENTFFNEIKKMQHGHYCRFKDNQSKVHFTRWYKLSESKRDPIVDSAELKALIKSAIELRMRSDVPVGVSLSGGIDSSSIVSLLSKEMGYGDLYTFSSVYKENHRANEKSKIDLVKLKNSKFVYPSAETFIDDMDELLKGQSEPFSTSAIYAQFKVMQLAKKNVTVLLDGQGADEYFAGYQYFHGFYYKGLLKSLRLLKLASESLSYLKKNKNFLNIKYLTYCISPAFLKRRRTLHEGFFLEKNFYKNNVMNSDILNNLYESNNLKESIENHFEYKLEHLLKWEDRNSMYFSLESRLPFLDYRLVEGVNNSPEDTRIHKGTLKYILRKSMSELVPKEILSDRNKIGYATPEDLWFRSEIFKSFLSKRLTRNDHISEKYLNLKSVKNLINEHIAGRNNYSNEIWRWLNLEMWLGKYFN